MLINKYEKVSLNQAVKFAERCLKNPVSVHDIALPFNTTINNEPYYVALDYTRGDDVSSGVRGFYLCIDHGSMKDGVYNYKSGQHVITLVRSVSRYSKRQSKIAHEVWPKYFLKGVKSLQKSAEVSAK